MQPDMPSQEKLPKIVPIQKGDKQRFSIVVWSSAGISSGLILIGDAVLPYILIKLVYKNKKFKQKIKPARIILRQTGKRRNWGFVQAEHAHLSRLVAAAAAAAAAPEGLAAAVRGGATTVPVGIGNTVILADLNVDPVVAYETLLIG